MNYLNIYFKIIDRAKSQTRSKKESYFEKHHIIPKCLNGTNLKENLVLLTAKEHFICHKLLHKSNPKNKSLFMAFYKMSSCISENQKRIKISSNDYEYLRRKNSDFNKGENNPNYKNKLNLHGSRNHKSKKIKIHGKIYDSINLASIEEKIPKTTLIRWLTDKKDGFEYIFENNA